jgi:hypothetical protein
MAREVQNPSFGAEKKSRETGFGGLFFFEKEMLGLISPEDLDEVGSIDGLVDGSLI